MRKVGSGHHLSYFVVEPLARVATSTPAPVVVCPTLLQAMTLLSESIPRGVVQLLAKQRRSSGPTVFGTLWTEIWILVGLLSNLRQCQILNLPAGACRGPLLNRNRRYIRGLYFKFAGKNHTPNHEQANYRNYVEMGPIVLPCHSPERRKCADCMA